MSSKFCQIRPGPHSYLPLNVQSQCCHFLSAVFHPILFILNDDMHESSNPTADYRVCCPRASEKNPHILIMRKTVLSFFSQILFILAGNDDIHKGLNEREIRPDPTRTTELAAFERLKNRCFSSNPYHTFR